MGVSESVAIVLEAFKAVEQRDSQRLRELYHPQVEFHWTPSLPFGGATRGVVRDRPGPSWLQVWEPLQPTRAERHMDPRVVAATENEVVVHWHQRGRSPSGERFDGEAFGLYEVRDGKFARADVLLRRDRRPAVPGRVRNRRRGCPATTSGGSKPSGS
jgi:ketosteroid isomerase-like protein